MHSLSWVRARGRSRAAVVAQLKFVCPRENLVMVDKFEELEQLSLHNWLIRSKLCCFVLTHLTPWNVDPRIRSGSDSFALVVETGHLVGSTKTSWQSLSLWRGKQTRAHLLNWSLENVSPSSVDHRHRDAWITVPGFTPWSIVQSLDLVLPVQFCHFWKCICNICGGFWEQCPPSEGVLSLQKYISYYSLILLSVVFWTISFVFVVFLLFLNCIS